MSDFRPKLGDKAIAVLQRSRIAPKATYGMFEDDEERIEFYDEKIPGRIELRYVFVTDSGSTMLIESLSRLEPPY